MSTFTHVGFLNFVGHVHASRLYGHADYRGKRHALNGPAKPYSGACYTALCGIEVRIDDAGFYDNVWPAAADSRISCKRCKKQIGPGSEKGTGSRAEATE